MIPVTAGMVVIAYNIPGVTGEIKLPRDVYVDIFAGDDPAMGRSPHPSCERRNRIPPYVRSKLLLGKMAVERRQLSPIISTRSAQHGAGKG